MKVPAAYSIGRRLSARLLALTMVVLGVLCAGIFGAAWTLHERSQQQILSLKISKLSETAQSLLRPADDRFLDLLRSNAPRRPGSRLELFNPDGSVFYQDPMEEPHLPPAHLKSRSFELRGTDGLARLSGSFAIDVEHDVKILRSLALVLLLATLLGSLAAGGIALIAVDHGLRPLRLITRQTQRISAGRLRDRLSLKRPVAELQPWVEQFNGLMDRMEGSYAQLEAFNADVAHELRTPLTSLIGKTEIALTRERSVTELSETLASNLEELHRMANLVNDMLFLSKSDRGATARRGPPVRLREVIGQVLEFHEAAAAEHGVAMEMVGDLEVCIDEPLFKRAISNLLSNATRHARPSSAVRVLIDRTEASARITVENQGMPVSPEHLPRLFDRFYRGDVSRQDSGSHHGLGLAIVAAIARMHGGSTFAESGDGGTRVGFTMAVAAATAAGTAGATVDPPVDAEVDTAGRATAPAVP